MRSTPPLHRSVLSESACGSVEQRGRVAFGQDETVIVVVVRVLRVILHMAEKQRGGKVRRREAGGWMTAAGRRGGLDGMDAQLVGDPFQQFNVRFNHKFLESKA